MLERASLVSSSIVAFAVVLAACASSLSDDPSESDTGDTTPIDDVRDEADGPGPELGSDLGAADLQGDDTPIGPGDGGGDDPTEAGDDGATGPDLSSDPDTGASDIPGDDAGGDTGTGSVVDASTLSGKVMMGYQGWFGAAGDESPFDNWRHWAPDVEPNAANVTFDAWPDLREYPASALFPTAFQYADDSVARLFSSYTPATVLLHFQWMRDYAIDGVFLQQFVSELGVGSPIRAFRDQVQANALAGAETYGRVLAVMYDISGSSADNYVARIQEHWQTLVDAGVTGGPSYLHHAGRPLVAIWGPGFNDRPGTPAQAQALIEWFQTNAPPAYRATVLGGVPSRWRSLDGDSLSDPAWTNVYLAYDIISPWTVGRYADDAGVRNFRADRVAPDLTATGAAGVEYLPVVWPGFSWTNLMDGSPLNQIPRRGGRLFWTQVYEFVDAGADMLFVAMFDEVDEGTAMFKLAETAASLPTTGSFLALDADGESLSSDFYLQLAREAGRVLRGERALSPERPLDPGLPTCSPPDTVLVGDRCVPSCGAAGGNSCDPVDCAGRPELEAYDCEVCCDTTD